MHSLHPWIQSTADCVVLKYLLLTKDLHISGHTQFKPMLFKGQLYYTSLLSTYENRHMSC